MHRHLLLLGALLLVGGCTRGKPHEVLREPSSTGAVSEAEFKAMHTLRGDAPPELLGQEVEVAGTKAYLSLPPDAKAPLPAVLLIHEWWGLNPHIRHWADRLAANGYAALAVDLYGGKVATTSDEALALLKAVDPARGMQVLKAAHAFLREDSRVRATRTGSLGWCFGGSWSLHAAMAIPELDAAVIYYGNPVTDPQELAAIRAPLLGIFGTKDASIPPETVQEFREALNAAGVRHRIVELEGEHAFANPSGQRYDERAAAMAWAETSMFFEHHLRR
ncbi:dienelactone hydrolase family protein [Myxococcus sp. CA051A]|uniref:dienelactone hydrolase family protein n=1 Tax=unclassified Myxococcus TaxID=2648731 RepID=UPI00157B6397|nr:MULTISPECIES: dienelactone hydrolase family protein [unclassified Myxococcus]NTX37157.1 dienelactone hydrolase family protein [Myxococcus sp. CA033]NTX60229.1 dienelactone hydrolase family protein [Myxococcus sp. CA051A]